MNIGKEIEKLDFGYHNIESEIAEQFVLDIVQKFKLNKNLVHIWDDNSLNIHTVISYGEDQWELELSKQLGVFEDNIFLVVTNDDPYPWDVYSGQKENLIILLNELPFFEYFIFDINFDRLLFDTHSNSLVLLK